MELKFQVEKEDSKMELDGKKVDKWEIDSLAAAIKQVKMAEKMRPELYGKAIEQLKSEVEAITDLDSLKRRAKKVLESDEEVKVEEEDEEEES
jgi:hypothetical protein